MGISRKALKSLLKKAKPQETEKAIKEKEELAPEPEAKSESSEQACIPPQIIPQNLPKMIFRTERTRYSLPKLSTKSLGAREDSLAKVRGVKETYPLITTTWQGKPYTMTYSTIQFNPFANQLIYNISEPEIDIKQQELVKKTLVMLQERLEIDFSQLKAKKEVYKYIDDKIEEIWSYLGVKLPDEQSLKVKYYIFRDTIGLGRIEPLMRDTQIEDLACDGTHTPVFIFHRNPSYGEMATNLWFDSKDELDGFVMKLAQKCGRTISVATPLLDATLPDGSRLQATFGTDIARHGSNFSIRKFFKVPLTFIDLMNYGTADPLLLAYLWLAIEEQLSILIAGTTATGKCVAPDCNIVLANGDVKTAEEVFKTCATETCVGEIITTPKKDLRVLTFNPETAKIEEASVSKLWKLKAPEKLVKVSVSGSTITTTPEHPFYVFNEGLLDRKRADQLTTEDILVLPRSLPVKPSRVKIDLLQEFKESEDIFAFGINNEVRNLTNKLLARYKTKAALARHLCVSRARLDEWCQKNAIPFKYVNKLCTLVGEKVNIKYIKSRKSSKIFKTLDEITPDLLEFVGYIIADGNLYKNNLRFTNTAEELLDRFLALGKQLFGIEGEKFYQKNRAPFARIFGRPIIMILEKLFAIPVGCKKADIVGLTEVIHRSPNSCISSLLRALFDSESSVSTRSCHIEFTTASKVLAEQLPVLLLRFGIVSGLSEKKVKEKTYYRLNIFGKDNLLYFAEKIGYNKNKKRAALEFITSKTKQAHSNIDLIYGVGDTLRKTIRTLNLTYKSIAERCGLSEGTLAAYCQGWRAPKPASLARVAGTLSEITAESGCEFSDVLADNLELLKKLANLEVVFLKPTKIDVQENKKFDFVYDFTIEKTHNFLAGNGLPFIISNTTFLNCICQFIPSNLKIVSIEDTSELQLMHVNWVPQTTRAGFGPKKYGEVTMFDLLKGALRQRPDYLLVGEVRGREADTMFHAMATGHPSISTMHADTVDAIIDRLTTRPIELPLALLENLDVLVFLEKGKKAGRFARRVSKVVEVEGYNRDAGRLDTNEIFIWRPVEDDFIARESHKLALIAKKLGWSQEQLNEELLRRASVLSWMKEKNIRQFKEVWRIINMYYSDPQRLAALMGSR